VVRIIGAVISVFFILLFGCAHKQDTAPPLVSSETTAVDHKKNDASEEKPAHDIALSDNSNDTDAFDEGDDLFDDDLESEDEDIAISDPLFYWNKAMFHFNDKLYFWLLKPVATGYEFVMPETVRIGIRNFFHNLAFPIRFLGCVLQAKGLEAQQELARFMFNTTIGIAGFGNPAKNYPHVNPKEEEDLGQAFGKWGIGEGFYVVWPFFGPSTLRDSFGLVGERFLNPVTYVEPTRDSLAITATKVVNRTSLSLGDYEAFKEAALDPYASMRDGYIQDRRKKVKN
jgi:phospholipid-binding lipoprotein MlaA